MRFKPRVREKDLGTTYRPAEQMQALQGKVGHDVQVLIFRQKVNLLRGHGDEDADELTSTSRDGSEKEA